MKKGFVALVGAGPGEVSLLTVRATELIKSADVVVFDRLVSDEILSLIPNGTETIDVGKENNNHKVPQEGINEILLREALLGKNVVRLKGGDPFVFGRGGEELDLLVKNDVRFEVVCGITSAISAPAFAGIPVTHRDFCSSFHVITGHQKKNESLKIDFESLVKTKGTLIFLMGVSSLEAITSGLLNAGIDKDMPMALIENGTRPVQRKVISTVENIVRDATERQFKSPSIIIVGKVCSLSDDFDWFSKRELFGKKIITTNPLNSNGKLQAKLKSLGATVIDLPAIKISKLEITEEIKNAISNISGFTWLVLTSKNAVNILFEEMKKMKKDSRLLANVKVCAIGVGTANELEKHGIIADFIPSVFQSDYLSKELTEQLSQNDKVLILKAEKGSDELAQNLCKNNISYKEYKLYNAEEIVEYSEEVQKYTDEKIIVSFTSASTVSSFVKNNPKIENCTAVCIGEKTSEIAREFGFKVEVSNVATMESLAEKIVEVASC